MKYEMCVYIFLKLKDKYCHLWNICICHLNFIIVFICHTKKKSCAYMSYKKKLWVYMSFNIKRHIYTSVISWWDVSLCVFKHQSAFLSLSASLCLRRFDGFSVKMPEFHSWTVRAQIAKSHRISRNPTSYGCFVCYKKKFLMKYMLNRISLHCRVEHIDLQKSFESICQGPTHVLISFFLSSSTCPQNTERLVKQTKGC